MSKPRKDKKKVRLPSDLADAAEVALDDMVSSSIDEDIETENRDPFVAPADTGEATAARARDEHDPTRRIPSVEEEELEPDVDDDEDVIDELPVLRFAIYEDSAHLGAAQATVIRGGHIVAVAAGTRAGSERSITRGGSDGVARVIDAIRSNSIDAVIVAMPGADAIIEAARALEPRRPIVIAVFDDDAPAAARRAVAAGADLSTTRPHDIERLAPLLLATVRLHSERRVALAARGSEQVLRARLEELADTEPRGLLPFELFQRVLELEIKRAKRFEYPLSVALFAVEVPPPPPPPGIRGILRARAGNVLIHTIRDIDIATQVDHERFLVLLPYTDLKGSAGLGRRVIAAVAAGDPVVAAGRSFPPRLVGAVAGAQPGQPVSFAKLMKDATRALEQARRDGAELAVQP